MRTSNDLSKPEPAGVQWTVHDGILHSGALRDTWLVSDAEYGDFVLEFEIKLTELGDGGVGLRTRSAAIRRSRRWNCKSRTCVTTPGQGERTNGALVIAPPAPPSQLPSQPMKPADQAERPASRSISTANELRIST